MNDEEKVNEPKELPILIERLDNMNMFLQTQATRLERLLHELRGPDEAPERAKENAVDTPSGHIETFRTRLRDLENQIETVQAYISELEQYI